MNGRVVLAVMGMALNAPVFAAELQVGVRLDVQRGCQLVGQQRSAGIEQLAVLDFGSTARLDDSAGPLSAAVSPQRLPRLECNPDTPYQLRIDGGQHGGVGDVRYMAVSDGPGQPIPYRLYQDSARRIPLAVNVPMSGRVPDTGSVDLPLYARVEQLAQIPRVGRYSDLVKVTVTW